MKIKIIYLIGLYLFLVGSVVGQEPLICTYLLPGYEKGEDFDITITERGEPPKVSDYLCLEEIGTVKRIGAIPKTSLNNVKYLFGISNISIPADLLRLYLQPTTDAFRDVNGANRGEFWVLQLGEDAGGRKLVSCKKIQIDVSDKPKVELSSCQGQEVSLKIESPTALNNYSVNWNDGSAVESVNYQNGAVTVTHTYQSSPTGVIEVQGVYKNTALNKACNSFPFKITPPSALIIKRLETQNFVNNQVASLLLNNPNNEKIDLVYNVNRGTYNLGINIKEDNAIIPNLPKENLCFKIIYNQGNCNYESLPVCSITPTADNSQYGEIEVKWNGIGTNTDYTLTRQGGTGKSIKTKDTQYIDKELDCDKKYDYQVEANYQDIYKNSVKVVSSFATINSNLGIDIQAKQALLATILPDGRPQLKIMDASGNLTYEVERSSGSLPSFTKVGTTKTDTYTDTGNAFNEKYCYRVRFDNVCNTQPPFSQPPFSPYSPVACTIYLKAENQDLTWNRPTQLNTAEINYDVNRIAPPNTVNQKDTLYSASNPVNVREEYQVEANIKYVVNGKTYEGKSISNKALIDFTTPLYLPDAFTPNQDSDNDSFDVKGNLDAITDYKMQIYNRGGNAIFETDKLSIGWDGKINGELAEIGVYAYKVEYTNKFGFKLSKVNKIMLLR
jgi:gliding motility-associated-like protein